VFALYQKEAPAGINVENHHRGKSKDSLRQVRRDQLPLKITARPSVVKTRDLNGIKEGCAECVGSFRIQ
jgi:hypothetical protein